MIEQVGKWRNWWRMKIDKRVEDKWGDTWSLAGQWVMDGRMAKKTDGRLDVWCWAVFGGHGRMDRCIDG